jgi:hypothetical protein
LAYITLRFFPSGHALFRWIARSSNHETRSPLCSVPVKVQISTAFDPATKLVFNSNGEGTVTVVHQDTPDKYSIVETVKTAPKAKTMALDPKTHRLFLSTAENGQFEVLVVGK